MEARAALAQWKRLADKHPNVYQFQAGLANAQFQIGVAEHRANNIKTALAEYKQSRILLNKLSEQDSANVNLRCQIISLSSTIAQILCYFHQFEDAKAESSAAYEMLKKHIAQHGDNQKHKAVLNQLRASMAINLAKVGDKIQSSQEVRTASILFEELTRENPDHTGYQVELGTANYMLGALAAKNSDTLDSLKRLNLAIGLLSPLVERERAGGPKIKGLDPSTSPPAQTLCFSHEERAGVHKRLGKFTESLADYDRAIELAPPMIAPRIRSGRLYTLGQLGQFERAFAEIDELSTLLFVRPVDRYNFACLYAVASGKVTDKKREYGDRAMGFLRKALTSGYREIAHMAKDTDLDPLRDREDFKKLMDESKTKYPPVKEILPAPQAKP